MCNSIFFVPMRGNSSSIVELADNYCNLGGRVAQVIRELDSPKGKIRYYKIYDEPHSLLSTILKIASYILLLGIPWLIACAIKAHHRYNVNYHEVPLPITAPRTEQRPPATSEDTSEVEDPVGKMVKRLLSDDQDLSTKGIMDIVFEEMSTGKPEGTAATSPAKIEGALHPMEKVQEELLAWWNEKDGSDKFKNRDTEIPNADLVSRLQQLAAQETSCPKKEIVLIWMGFGYGGFGFFYAHMPEGNKHLPLLRQVGCLLDIAREKEIELPWLTKDPVTGKQVIVQVQKELGQSKIEKIGGSMTVGSYLNNLMYDSQGDRTSEEFRILEALTPYAFNVKKTLGDTTYQQLRTLIPTYPENPGSHLA